MRLRKLKVTASILGADFAHLQDEIDAVATADAVQIDVMDGHFVPTLSFGALVVKDLKTALPLDIHLMVENPEDRIEEFLGMGAAHITFHAEAIPDTENRRALIAAIKNTGATAGIAINPETPMDAVSDVLADVDRVLVMSVHPGAAGQKFLPEVLPKVSKILKKRPDLEIQLDGGITAQNVPQCIRTGARNLVAASAIFSKEDRAAAINALRMACS